MSIENLAIISIIFNKKSKMNIIKTIFRKVKNRFNRYYYKNKKFNTEDEFYTYLFTKDPRFSAKVMNSFETLLSRATLISKTGEKDRNRFFNALREKVNGLKK